MFGLWETASLASYGPNGLEGRIAGAVTMGLFVGFVAAPCVGPFVFSLLTYVAAKRSVPLGLGLFFTLAMGSASLPRPRDGVGKPREAPAVGRVDEAAAAIFSFASSRSPSTS